MLVYQTCGTAPVRLRALEGTLALTGDEPQVQGRGREHILPAQLVTAP